MDTGHATYTADPSTIQGATAADVATVNQWRHEGRTLTSHVGKTPVHYPGSLKIAEQEAKAYGLKGALRLLYIAERYEGWLAAESGAVGEGGLVSVLTLGLLKGESTHGTGTPAKGGGGVDIGTSKGSATVAENAAENPAGALGSIGEAIAGAVTKLIETYGPRLLEIVAGAGLVLFGLATLAKSAQRGVMP